MTPAVLNLQIKRGVTFGPVTLAGYDASNVVANTVGFSVYAEARLQPCGPLAFDLAPAISNSGVITLGLSKEATANLPVGTYGYDLLLQDGAGIRQGPYFAGRVSVADVHTQPV